MSIADKITRLQTAKTNIASAITNKGGTVQSGDGFESFATDIGTIPSGGTDWVSRMASVSFVNCSNFNETEDITFPALTSLAQTFYSVGYNGNRNGIPYLTVRLAKQITGMNYGFSLSGYGGQDSQKITIIGDLSKVQTYAFAFASVGATEIDADLDFSSVTQSGRVSGVFHNCQNLQTVRFVPNTLKFGGGANMFLLCNSLSDASLVSIANGLSESASSQTITLPDTPKARLSSIMGTVTLDSTSTYHIFTVDASGTTTLENFITSTKGWTVA